MTEPINGDNLLRRLNSHIDKLVPDPTTNVLAAVAALEVRHRELRIADNKYSDSENRHIRDMADLRAMYAKDIRISDLAVAAQTRLVDVGGQAASAASIATAVLALQNTTDRNAETLRTTLANSNAALAKQVVDSAQAIATQTATTNTAMDTRVSGIERSIATGVGRQSRDDPQMLLLMEKLDKLAPVVAAREVTEQVTTDNSTKLIGYVIGGLGLVFGFVGTAVAVVLAVVQFSK